MKPVVISLYRSLLRKARIATKQQEHLFRFQRAPTAELWGKGIMYDIKHDRRMMEDIFPESTHEFIDNKYPFNPRKSCDAESEDKLHSEFSPDYVKDPYFDHAYNAVTDEDKLKEKVARTSTPKSSALYRGEERDGAVINEYDYHRLKYTIRSIVDQYRGESDLDRINELISDGFTVLREFDAQISTNHCTSISESNGIRIIATAAPVAGIVGHDQSKPHGFTYKLRIENHGHQWVQLLGRHWVIIDDNDNKEVLERFQPGVVGLQPQLNEGEIFIYGSGTFLSTEKGKMYGSLQFTNMNGELFEVPISSFRLNASQ